MSEQAMNLTLAEKARSLTAHARSKSASAADDDARQRLERQIATLSTEIGTLTSVLATHRALASKGVEVATLPDLHKARREIADHVARIGPPSPQYLQSRVKAVGVAHTQIAEADREAWMVWATRKVDELPLESLPRLVGQRRADNQRRVQQLREYARKAPDPGMITQFHTMLGLLTSDLEQVETDAVGAVLARFVGRRILLADLSEEEVALLRADPALRDQLYVALS